jgi:hypothetical protein
VPARHARKIVPLSMLPVIRLTAADPATLIRAYCTICGDDAKPEPTPNGSRKILDVFDGTPLLDIKPYIKELDSKSDGNFGWLEDLDDRDQFMLHIKGIPHD